ncbi:hypothetical protein QAD02_003018 [Eretmocerus hayati]|uniref:Uncharacterized protein n=1 Tax=Eretmocerus hayati TaxID=131215 RepID=A0ACC2NKX4_9HYME|nr:hypothetical protein QAD02_003018 [Eretmocerus hayati]
MSPEQFQFVVVKFLQNLDKNCTKQFGELNRKVGLLTKKVDELQTKVESIACTPVTMSNTIDNEMRKYLKPADMDKFQELEDNLKNAKLHNKMVTFLTSLKGLTVNDSVYNIMYASLDDRFAMKFSYHGVKAKDWKPAKDSFVDTQLCSCVYVALQRSHNNPCLDQIKKSLQTWLDQAKNRTNRSNEKSDKPSRKKAFVPIIPEDSENESEAEESIE